jgi:hypothetical protein
MTQSARSPGGCYHDAIRLLIELQVGGYPVKHFNLFEINVRKGHLKIRLRLTVGGMSLT